jgi:hypothetical protein
MVINGNPRIKLKNQWLLNQCLVKTLPYLANKDPMGRKTRNPTEVRAPCAMISFSYIGTMSDLSCGGMSGVELGDALLVGARRKDDVAEGEPT